MKPNEQEEYELAVRAQQGDLDGLSALVERLRLRLFAIAYADLRHYEDAQDAVACALVRICSHIGDLRDISRIHAWMHAIVRNETRRIQRQRTTTASHINLCEVSELPAPPELSLLRLDVENALCRLPADQAHALALFYLGNITIREIAQRTNRPEGTVKSWLHHGRRQLAQSMKEYAPMTMNDSVEWIASIVSDSMEPATVISLSDALRRAGFSRVNVFHDCRQIIRKSANSEFPYKEMLHLPDALKETRFLILDQRIGNHSAFELSLILRAAEKEDTVTVAHGILIDQFDPADGDAHPISVYASWLAGFEMCMSKPVDPKEFEGLSRHIRESLASQSEETQ